MPPDMRGNIFSRHVKDHPDDVSLWPSWKQFVAQDHSAWMRIVDDQTSPGAPLDLVGDSRLGVHERGTYVQEVLSFGRCIIVRQGRNDKNNNRAFSVRCQGHVRKIHGVIGGTVSRDVTYMFLQLELKTWLVVEVNGKRQDEGLRTVFEVVKRGCILLENVPSFSPRRTVTVMYTSSS
ncbi:uncharacterized protein PHACADRAFT_260212 [Phanerochaete carnosa HHB-10118-sp]|uniref:Uncharacterized protein n=1 Tax=Phanerochaete carnosa (strain HHB-10118-sp) TaxID=650164 RepID=K5W451_PHACS|nr:uncharacterized protein PHACADRAFT_260212 [Phanerochaete carnosa HHB-10118-sp]EKM53724.1 hypothetical protein PHACADRAFT_260212 [Phanerochaete carnosa HHB-10118-sp]